MAKVKSTMTLTRSKDGWALKLPTGYNLKQQLVDKFIRSDEVQSIILEMEIRAPFKEKTLSQLGYLHAAVWPVFYQYYRDQGIQVESKEQMEDVRDSVKMALGFVKSITDIHGELHTKPKSLADASKDEVRDLIDWIIRLAADFGMIVPGPEEYLEKHGKTEFEG
jgi:hypothetical protein